MSAPAVCLWCRKPYEEHEEPSPGRAIAKTPCLGLRSGFVPAPAPRASAPDLLTEVERLRRENATLREQLEQEAADGVTADHERDDAEEEVTRLTAEVEHLRAELNHQAALWQTALGHAAEQDAEIKALLGELARDREDAARYRAIVAETNAVLSRDEEYLAAVEQAKREQAEAAEELRLLRAVEVARVHHEEALRHEDKFSLRECVNRRALMEAAWKSLADFRARQKGAGS